MIEWQWLILIIPATIAGFSVGSALTSRAARKEIECAMGVRTLTEKVKARQDDDR